VELTTILGCAAGVIAVVIAMHFKGISYSAFENPAALTIIFMGTVASVLNAFPLRDLKVTGTLFKILFTTDKNLGDPATIIETIVGLSTQARKEGILSLEATADKLEDPFMRKGIKMLVDGADPEYILDVLSLEIESIEERHNKNAGIFSQAGTYAPTLGVLGAVFGLIAAMSHIDDINMMAEAVAAAFIATILGIFTGYVLWNPFSNKLKVKSKHEIDEKNMIIEGLLSIQKGEAPMLVRDKLMSMLPESQQKSLAPEPPK